VGDGVLWFDEDLNVKNEQIWITFIFHKKTLFQFIFRPFFSHFLSFLFSLLFTSDFYLSSTIESTTMQSEAIVNKS
jgi:hypothetical protein